VRQRQRAEQGDRQTQRADRETTRHAELQRPARVGRALRRCEEPPPDQRAGGDHEHLRGRAAPRQDHDCSEDRDGTADDAPRQRAAHLPDGHRHDGDRGQLEPVHPAGVRDVAAADAVGERDQHDGGGQRETQPRRQTTERTGAQHPDREPELARRRAGQELDERHQIGEVGVVQPPAARDVRLAEVADVRGRAAERRQPEPERDAEHLGGAARLRPGGAQLTGTLAVCSAVRTASAAACPESIAVSVYEPPR